MLSPNHTTLLPISSNLHLPPSGWFICPFGPATAPSRWVHFTSQCSRTWCGCDEGDSRFRRARRSGIDEPWSCYLALFERHSAARVNRCLNVIQLLVWTFALRRIASACYHRCQCRLFLYLMFLNQKKNTGKEGKNMLARRDCSNIEPPPPIEWPLRRFSFTCPSASESSIN